MAQEINYTHSRWLPQHGPASYSNYGVRVAPAPNNGAAAAAYYGAPMAVAAGGGGGGRPIRAAAVAGQDQRHQAAAVNRAVGKQIRNMD